MKLFGEKKHILLLAGGLVLLLLLAGILYNTLSNGMPQDIGVRDETIMAPAFTVWDGDGREVAFDDLKGVPMVINFWTSWCGPCKSEMPNFQMVADEYDDNELRFMMINVTVDSGETQENARAYIEENGYTFPVYYDLEGQAMGIYGVTAYPSSVFINAEGEIVGAVVGALSEASLRSGIELAFA